MSDQQVDSLVDRRGFVLAALAAAAAATATGTGAALLLENKNKPTAPIPPPSLPKPAPVVAAAGEGMEALRLQLANVLAENTRLRAQLGATQGQLDLARNSEADKLSSSDQAWQL